MRKILASLIAALTLTAAAASASAATVPVTGLSGSFKATNSTVTLTTDGVHFGTYADGGKLGGTLITHDYDGLTLADITDLGYTFNYRVGDQPAGYTAAPYLRIFLDTDGDGVVDNDVLLDPGYCATEDVAQSEDLTFQMVGNTRLRYSDDGCDSLANVASWEDIVAAHGTEAIVGVLVSQGNSVGHDVSAVLRSMTINGDTFAFGAPQAGPEGPAGPVGPGGAQGSTGATGATGSAGAQGAAGPAGVAGPAGPAGSAGPAGKNGSTVAAQGTQCLGDGTRTLHAPTRKGWKFVKAVATLRGKALPVQGRAITVALPSVEGNYNVRIVARYRKANGRTLTVKQSRNLSVACA